MAGENVHPQLRRALLGIRREDVEALQAQLARLGDELATLRGENTELTASLDSTKLALGEAAGWSERLPAALRELATLAAGELNGEDPAPRLASAILALAGEHLLSSVDVFIGQPDGELQRNTRLNENGRPVGTIVQLGGCSVNCTWQPGVDAGPDTVQVIEGLCTAVVSSLAGLATTRVHRHDVTQLGDERAFSRHLALRYRSEAPCELVAVAVDEQSAIRHRELFGRLAWDASLADAASVLDRLARDHGGQAYHIADREFRVLVDLDHGTQACELIKQELEIYDDLIFTVNVDER